MTLPVLAPAGPEAASIVRYWWLTLGVAVVVLAAVAAVVLYAMARRRAIGPPPPPITPGPERGLAIAVTAATGVTVATLLVLLIASIVTSGALHPRDSGDARGRGTAARSAASADTIRGARR